MRLHNMGIVAILVCVLSSGFMIQPGVLAASLETTVQHNTCEQGIAIPAKLKYMPDTRSFYPSNLWQRGVCESVIVHVFISADGVVTNACIATSSGHEEMDGAALKIAYGCHYDPAKNIAGQPASCDKNMSIYFRTS